MSHILSVRSSNKVQNTLSFNKEDFNKIWIEDSDIGYFLKVNVKHSEKLHERDNDLSFSPERMQIGKFLKLVFSLHDKKECIVHIRISKQALNHG